MSEESGLHSNHDEIMDFGRIAGVFGRIMGILIGFWKSQYMMLPIYLPPMNTF